MNAQQPDDHLMPLFATTSPIASHVFKHWPADWPPINDKPRLTVNQDLATRGAEMVARQIIKSLGSPESGVRSPESRRGGSSTGLATNH